MTSLELLQVRNIRGIRRLDLPFGGGSIVLGGGNGTGKSACVDALELLYTGQISTLAGTQGISLRQHGAHIRSTPEEASVTGTFSNPAGSVTRRLTGQLEIPGALQEHMAQGEQRSFILRRSQLQQFIHAKPADRYRSMADLIGAERLERQELELKHARDALKRSRQEAEAGVAQIDRQISELPEDVDDQTLIEEANAQLASLPTSERYRLENFADIPEVRSEVLRQISGRRPDPGREAEARIAAELRRGIGQDRVRATLGAYLALIAPDRSSPPARAVELLQLLKRSREYLRDSPTDRCPVCEREINGRRVFDRLVERVAELEEVSLLEQRLQAAREDLMFALQDTSARLRALEPLTGEPHTRRPDGAIPAAAGPLNAIAMLLDSVRAGATVESREMADRTADALARWESVAGEWLAAHESSLAEEIGAEEDPAAAVLAVLEGVATQRARAERGRQELERLTFERERLGRGMAPLKTACEIADATYVAFNRVKNEEIQRIFDELRADLAGLYDFLHPGEGHGAVAIAMDPRKRGSSDLRMGFYSRRDEDPRAFASEGHLDSLGVCIFLAFARKFNGDWPLLVLDDVVTSVDALHKQRVARLLFQEFGDRQLFITTNDSRWFAELRRAQEETGCTDCTNLIIESWSLEEGPILRDMAA